MPASGPDGWICSCGAENHVAHSTCFRCGAERTVPSFRLRAAAPDPAAPSASAPSAGPAPSASPAAAPSAPSRGPFKLSPLQAAAAGFIPVAVLAAVLVISQANRLSASSGGTGTTSGGGTATYGGATAYGGYPGTSPTFGTPVALSPSTFPLYAVTGPDGRRILLSPEHRLYWEPQPDNLPPLFSLDNLPAPPPPRPDDPPLTYEPVPPERVAALIEPSVVLIVVATGHGSRTGAGFMAAGQRIATCEHLVRDAQSVVVVTTERRRYPAAVSTLDPANDVAILNCSGSELPRALYLGDSNIVKAGEAFGVSGFAATDTERPTPTTGFGRLAERQSTDGIDRFRLESQTPADLSGGPVYSLQDGAVYGILTARLDREREYATPVNAVKRMLEREAAQRRSYAARWRRR